MRRLQLPADCTVEEETVLARKATARAALRALEAEEGSKPVRLLRLEYAARAEDLAEPRSDEADLAGLQRRTVAAQREALLGLRRNGTIGDDAFHAIEAELDIIELTADPRIRALGPNASVRQG